MRVGTRMVCRVDTRGSEACPTSHCIRKQHRTLDDQGHHRRNRTRRHDHYLGLWPARPPAERQHIDHQRKRPSMPAKAHRKGRCKPPPSERPNRGPRRLGPEMVCACHTHNSTSRLQAAGINGRSSQVETCTPHGGVADCPCRSILVMWPTETTNAICA